ncbi:MAG: aminotransferase class V-fold PLP-dependent enzyme [Rhodovibrionaceae bacterium]
MSENRARDTIYLDYQASTPCDPRVVEAMLPYFTEQFGNPHSVEHAYGWDAAEAVEKARSDLAALLKAEPREVIFTSGATESNNLAVKGAARFLKDRRPHLVIAETEHKCVLESAKRLEREGHRVTWLSVQASGLVELAELEAAITSETALVSIMAVNNEIGTIQPLAEIGALCREKGALFHTDAAQAVGKIPLDVGAMNIDLLSVSGHKMYGPKGIGALYIRRRPRVRLDPMMDGGGQERATRSGTLSPALCAGLGTAAALAAREMEDEGKRLLALRARFLEDLRKRLPDLEVNGDLDYRVAGNLNLRIPGLRGEELLKALPRLALSTGSACSSASVEPSYVIRALGVPEESASQAFRIGLGRFTTGSELARAAEMIAAAAAHLRDGAGRAQG